MHTNEDTYNCQSWVIDHSLLIVSIDRLDKSEIQCIQWDLGQIDQISILQNEVAEISRFSVFFFLSVKFYCPVDDI